MYTEVYLGPCQTWSICETSELLKVAISAKKLQQKSTVQKMKLSIKDFLVNVTKFAVSCEYGHIN